MVYPAELRCVSASISPIGRASATAFRSIVSRVALWSCEQTQNRFDAAGYSAQALQGRLK